VGGRVSFKQREVAGEGVASFLKEENSKKKLIRRKREKRVPPISHEGEQFLTSISKKGKDNR